MDGDSLAPCGVLCDLCAGFQRKRDTCVGCNAEGYKPRHCTVCAIKLCPEKKGNPRLLCGDCEKFPCRRIKDLNKRYETQYGESILGNFREKGALGMDAFIALRTREYTCPSCGSLLCVHRDRCLHCGASNPRLPGAAIK